MLTNERLTPHIQQMRQRVQNLYQEGNGVTPPSDVLAAAFEELEIALEQLQIADARQRQELEAWLNERAMLEMEMQSSQHLFDNAPAGYLVTSLDGTIRKANPRAAKVLECPERHLIGRSIVLFVPEGQRREFRSQIAQIAEQDGIHEKQITMQSWERNSFEAGLTVSAVYGRTGQRPTALHWLVRDISEYQQATPALAEREVGAGLDGGTLADRAGASLARGSQSDTEEQTRQQFVFLARAISELSQADDLDEIIGRVAHLAVPEQADACIIDLADPQAESTQRLVVMRAAQSKNGVRSWRSTLTPQARADKHAHAESPKAPLMATQLSQIDISKHEHMRAILGTLELGSAIVTPLHCGERQFGSITFVRSKTERQYGAADVALFEVLANALSDVIARLLAL